MSRRRKYSYRGKVIVQTYRTHDVRNKTHNGYSWEVEFRGGDHGTRQKAKASVDRLVEMEQSL